MIDVGYLQIIILIVIAFVQVFNTTILILMFFKKEEKPLPVINKEVSLNKYKKPMLADTQL